MEAFAVDRSFYDIGAGDLKELWDSDLDPEMRDVLRSSEDVEWNLMERDGTLPEVVLHDRLMTDAALGPLPIKTEHSYSLASDGDSLPDSPVSHNRMDDMENECFPAISMNSASCRVPLSIKDEPLSEPESPTSSCPSSPLPHFKTSQDLMDYTIDADVLTLKSTNVMLSTPRTSIYGSQARASSSGKTSLKNIKLELNSSVMGTAFSLPPTPPSCSSSSSEDSEDNAACSQPSSPSGRALASRAAAAAAATAASAPSLATATATTTTRLLVPAQQTSTRQPIHTPLISSQPKGSTGQLVLTEEEKRTLLAEGYPVPTRLPLTKAEEKSLKKIRRKIKNKISAQESRRKKKEYMDQLERKVEILVAENSDYRKKIDSLEASNGNLLSQLTKLQTFISRSHPQTAPKMLK